MSVCIYQIIKKEKTDDNDSDFINLLYYTLTMQENRFFLISTKLQSQASKESLCVKKFLPLRPKNIIKQKERWEWENKKQNI